VTRSDDFSELKLLMINDVLVGVFSDLVHNEISQIKKVLCFLLCGFHLGCLILGFEYGWLWLGFFKMRKV
jgi:hypothetical protein